jgi:benzoate membrane transport protein
MQRPPDARSSTPGRRLRPGDAHALGAGVVAALVGFTSSFVIVLDGLRAVGAGEAQAASGLLVMCVVMGALGIVLSARARMPISVAWATPGAALLVSAGRNHYGYSAAIGAFLIAGALVVATAVLRPLGRLVGAIPPALGSALLAGILLQLCIAPVHAVVQLPRLAIPVVLTWTVLDRLVPRLAVPGAVVASVVAVALTEPLGALLAEHGLPVLRWTTPSFSGAAFVGIAVPLFVVSMAAQNVPGMAVLASFGYKPKLRPLLVATGGATVVAAPLGAISITLAAITAALCAGPEAHRDPGRRWLASVGGGCTYLVLGVGAGALATLATVAPPLVLETVAGVALLRPLASALGALAGASAGAGRDAAIVTFVVTASGISPGGIGSPFWGLLAGSALTLLEGRRSPAAG